MASTDEEVARVIAMWHGSKMVVMTDDGMQTVASRAGFGRFAGASDHYAEKHWHQYLQAAQAMQAMVAEAVADEREACAQIADEWVKHGAPYDFPASTLAQAIRARGNAANQT